jgi:hypothetical protein
MYVDFFEKHHSRMIRFFHGAVVLSILCLSSRLLALPWMHDAWNDRVADHVWVAYGSGHGVGAAGIRTVGVGRFAR